MITLNPRLIAEQQFHDQQARQRRQSLTEHQESLRFSDESYLQHASWIADAFAQLGDLRGKIVLDYGCGHGMASVVLRRRGAKEVHAFDLSSEYVQETQLRATANGVEVQATVANAEVLPYADATFDGIWGNAILHHLDLDKAAREIKRVLKPGGIAIFCEPWAGNPILEFARQHLPYPGKQRTDDEQPLSVIDLPPIQKHFPNLQVHSHELFGMMSRLWPTCPWQSRLRQLDQKLFQKWPRSKNWARYVVLKLRKV